MDEWRKVTAELAPVYETLLDITRGPERLYLYLAKDFQYHGGFSQKPCNKCSRLSTVGRELTEDELRRLITVVLDTNAHQLWFNVEGRNRLPSGRMASGWDDAVRKAAKQDPNPLGRSIEEASNVVSEIMQELQEMGTLEPEHLALLRPYLRRLLAARGKSTMPPFGDCHLFSRHRDINNLRTRSCAKKG